MLKAVICEFQRNGKNDPWERGFALAHDEGSVVTIVPADATSGADVLVKEPFAYRLHWQSGTLAMHPTMEFA